MKSNLNNQLNETLAKLEQVADGIDLHKNDPGFLIANEGESLRALKTQLEDARQEYVTSENAARIKHDVYMVKLKESEESLTKLSSIITGLYGKRNQVIADFGLLPYKKPGRNGSSKTNGEASQQSS